MSSLYNNAVKQSNLLQKSLGELRDNPDHAPNRLVGQVSTLITSFQRAIDSYNGSISNEPVPDKKELALSRVKSFREQLLSAREELRTLKAHREESIISKNRAELFQGTGRVNQRAVLNDNNVLGTASENPFAGVPDNSGIDRATGMSRESDVLARATQSIDEFLDMGRHAFADLSEQNELLRKTSQGMRKVANTLGISNETIRKIQRRAKQDKWIFWGGVATMLTCFYLIIRWLR